MHLTNQVAWLKFSTAAPSVAVKTILRSATNASTGTPIYFANAYTVALAEADSSYRELLNGAGYTFADGKPISWLSKLVRHKPLIQQVRGPEAFEAVIDAGQVLGIRHFLLGSTDEVLEKLEANLLQRYPRANIVGKLSPPFRIPSAEELRRRDEEILQTQAQIVWVGLGTPKQDFEAARVAASCSVTAVAVGAAFDFSAGRKPAAPKWMGSVGLEWLFRLITEPKRLWRRYLFGNAAFLRSCWIHRADLRRLAP